MPPTNRLRLPKPLNVSPQIAAEEVSLAAAVRATELKDNPQLFIEAKRKDVGAALVELVKQHSVRSLPFDLNIIDESNGGVIVINHVQFDSEANFPKELADLLKGRVRLIRLLGCNTASSKLGWAAMLALSEALGIEVQGTRRPISQGDFDAIGLKVDALKELWSSKKRTRPPSEAFLRLKPNARTMPFDGPPPSLEREWLERHPVAKDFDLDQIVKRHIAAGIPHDAFPGGLPKRWYEVKGVFARRVFGIGVTFRSGSFVVDVLPGGRLLRVRATGKRALFGMAGRVITESLFNGSLIRRPPHRSSVNGYRTSRRSNGVAVAGQ